MAIDTSIYNNLLRPPKSIAEYDAEAMQGQQNRLAIQMGQAKMEEYQNGLQRTNKLNALLGGFKPGMSTAEQGDTLTRSGFVDEGRKVIESGAKANKDQRDAEKAAREAEKFELESHFKKFELAGQIMNGVTDQATWDRARQQTAQVFGPEAAAQMPEQYDPKLIAEKRAQAMTVKDQIENTWKAKGFDLEVQKFGETVRNNKEQTATSRANNAATVNASLANAAATREIAGATRDAAKITRDQGTEMKLADDYRMQSKPFKEVGDAYRQINATLDKAATSPAATLAAATKFMKMLDPGSVVRESELMMALQATGVIDRAFNYFETLKRGKVLTPSQVQDFKTITGQIYGAAQESQRAIDGNYQNQAKQYGLRPDMIVQDLGQNVKPAAPTSKGAKFLGFE